jgi:FkbM family methyltransferase
MPFVSYAQNFEDVMLWRALGHVQNGFYVDVGAWSPDLHSVTKAFSERGWRGINIEPNPYYFAQLVEKRPFDTNLAVAVGDRVGIVSMNFIEDTGLSTADPRIAEAHVAAGWAARQEQVRMTTLAAIWSRHVPAAQPVHFLKVDVEGLEKAALVGNDWQLNRPWIVVVEATRPLSQIANHDEWEHVLRSARYAHCYSDGLNRYYVAAEHADLQKAFRFPPNVFDGFVLAEIVHQTSRAEAAEGKVRKVDAPSGQVGYEQVHSDDRLSQVEAQLAQALQALETAESRRVDAQRHASETLHLAKAQTANRRAATAGASAFLAPSSIRRYGRRVLKAAWWAVTPWRLPQRLRFIRDRSAAMKLALPKQALPKQGPAPAGLAPPPTGPYALWVSGVESRSPLVGLPIGDAPLVSFLICGAGDRANLLRTLKSIHEQPHSAWEVVLCTTAEDLTANDALLIDSRVLVATTGEGDKPSRLHAALEMARGQFVAVLDCGDVLAPYALNEFSVALERLPEADLFYSDEDERSNAGFRNAPYFKPSWSPDLLYAFNYFGRLTILRRTLVLAAGGIDTSTGAAVEWDLNLRVSDLAQQIQRIPKVLCHRKPGSDRERPAASTREAADHRGVIEKYWRAHEFPAIAETQSDGTQRTTWTIEKLPLVSVVIPTKDKVQLLRMCIDGLLLGTDYANKEIVIVDTGSTEAETLAYFSELAVHPEVRIVRFEKKFNYSAACNYGASCSHGQMLLFLNNDIEVISRDWLQEMVRFAMRPGVGVVGTKLVYPSGELQHGGVGVGPHLCALMYRSNPEHEWGVFGSPDHPRNWLAIMGACQLVRRDAFERVGSFDESYLVAMSDVALCLQIWRAGYRTAYAPSACLVHHEGATRGNANPVEDVRRIADDIRLLGIDEDPYLHPELDGNSAIPALRGRDAPGVRDVLRKRVDEDGSFPAPVVQLDLADDSACLEVTGLPRELVFWSPQPAHRVCDKWSAARWVLDLLRTRKDIRERFPKALSDGAAGDFARWLTSEAQAHLGVSETLADALEQLFSEDISANARQTFLFRADVRELMPHGLTPTGQLGLFRWFMQNGRSEAGLRLEEIWWLFWQAAESPAHELVRAYLFTPAWQRLYPDAMTVFGRQAFAAWFAATYRAKGDWIEPSQWSLEVLPASQLRFAYHAREHWRTRHPQALEDVDEAVMLIDWLQSDDAMQSAEVRAWCAELDKHAVAAKLVAPGANVIGHFCYPSGLRVSVEALVEGLQRAGNAVSLRDLRTDKKDDPHHVAFDGLEDFDATIIHTQPEPFFDQVYERADLAARSPRTYRVAYWYWEFDSIPDSWVAQAAKVDEVWTATNFVAKGLRERLSIPVRTLFPGVKLGAYQRRDPEYFGVESGKFSFLFTFHMMSVMERKNPLGLIRAFKEAFREHDAVQLVLKTSFGDRHRTQIQELSDAAAGANITVIDKVYNPDEVLSLMDACDAYVSLHRSEGLGLTMAEAMLMGKPVIATNFSGNVDFMDESNSLLVPYKLVKLGKPIPPYDADLEWAEPSVEHAAQLMRRVYDNQQWAREVGARGKASAEANLSLDAAGRRIAARLEEIKALRRAAR